MHTIMVYALLVSYNNGWLNINDSGTIKNVPPKILHNVKWQYPSKGSFTNYVDQILPIIDHLKTPVNINWILCYTKISTSFTISLDEVNFFFVCTILILFWHWNLNSKLFFSTQNCPYDHKVILINTKLS